MSLSRRAIRHNKKIFFLKNIFPKKIALKMLDKYINNYTVAMNHDQLFK